MNTAFDDIMTTGLPARKGLLIVFEGIDGCGKSTQAELLHQRLQKSGLSSDFSFEPTNEIHGRALRDLWRSGRRHDPAEELQLFRDDRRDHIEKVIAPMLRSGGIAVVDRYYYSSIAYQGTRAGNSIEEVTRLMSDFCPVPDVTFLFELDVDKALERILTNRGETPDVMEKREDLTRVKAAYEKFDSPEIVRISAEGSVAELASRVWKETVTFLKKFDYSF